MVRRPAVFRLPVWSLKAWMMALSLLMGLPVLVGLASTWWSQPGSAPAGPLYASAATLAIGFAGAYAIVHALSRELRSPDSGPQQAGPQHIREIADFMARHQAATRALRAVNGNRLQAEEAERRRLARELHDQLGQELALLHMWLQTVQGDGMDEGTHRQLLRDCGALAATLMERVRSMALDLRPAQLDDLGLSAALGALARRVGRQTGITVTLLTLPQNVVPRFPDAVETSLFRIAQAAVTNAVRHAGASTLWIALEVQDGLATVKVQDDGAGFDVDEVRARSAAGTGMGLLVMEERVQALGGTMDIISAPEAGTLVRASVPLGARG